jgi:hypothetical protein
MRDRASAIGTESGSNKSEFVSDGSLHEAAPTRNLTTLIKGI